MTAQTVIEKNGRTAEVTEYLFRGRKVFRVKCETAHYECRTMKAAKKWAEMMLGAWEK